MKTNPAPRHQAVHAKKRIQSRPKHRRLLRRVTVISLCAVAVGLLAVLGWQIAHGIASVDNPGNQPVSTPTTKASTTTAATHATLSVGADVTTPRIVLYDVTHNITLFSRDADRQCYPASMTKLLTAMVASDYCTADEVFTVGNELELMQPQSSVAPVYKGYKLTRDMIIDAMLLPSGNDAAYCIAAHVGRKKSDSGASDLEALFTFIDLMNAKAQELGATHSHFSNPDGYFSANHYTTASDMMLIARAALQYDNLAATMRKTSATHTLLSGQTVTFKNSNVIVNPASAFYFKGATGLKTGFTDEAGYCVAASAERDGVSVIAVMMGGVTSNNRWQDTVNLLNQAFALEKAQS